MSRVGVHKVDITPPLGIEFIGYHRPYGIKNVDERIYATVFVFEYKQTKTLFISIDNIGMLIEDTTIIREQIANDLNIPFGNITVVYSHTHSGPATVSNSETVQGYKTTLVKNVIEAAVKANEFMQPSEVGWSVTEGEIGINRREETSDGNVIMGTNENGIVDKRIGVLVVRYQDRQELAGAIVFCTAHPNVLKADSDILSADYPGLTREILEQSLGCTVMIVQGATGNVNAKYRGSMKSLKQMAYTLSGIVLTMIPRIDFKSIFKLETISTTLTMKLQKIPEPDKIKNLALLVEKRWGVNTDNWLTVILDKYKQNERKLSIDLEIQLFQLNEGSFSGIPMEPFSESALEIKETLNNPLAFLGGYTNGYLGYLPTKEAYPYGGYEVKLNPVVYGPITGLWMAPVRDTAQSVVNRILAILRKGG